MIKFDSKMAGKGKAFCPYCGKSRKIIELCDVSTSTNEGDNFDSECATIKCNDCGYFEIMKVLHS